MPAPIEPLRYCVLLHAIPQQGVHYDLLLSVPRQEALASWRLLAWPPRF